MIVVEGFCRYILDIGSFPRSVISPPYNLIVGAYRYVYFQFSTPARYNYPLHVSMSYNASVFLSH